MRQKTSALLTLGLCVVLAVTLVVTAAAHNREKKAAEVYSGGSITEETAEIGTKKTGLFARATETPEPTATPEPTLEPTPTPKPGPEVERQPSPAPAGYFADAAFVGNSVVTGLDLYDYDDLLAGADFYAANSVTVLGVSEYVQQMEGTTYGKVYVGLGTNEMSYDKDALRSCFNDMIDTLWEYNPDCIIYLMSVTPVSKYKSENNSSFTRELAVEFNEMLKEIAEARGVYYLDVFSVLADADGYLPSEVTVDGIHFTPAHYEAWFELLTTYYVPAAVVPAAEDASAEPIE